LPDFFCQTPSEADQAMARLAAALSVVALASALSSLSIRLAASLENPDTAWLLDWREAITSLMEIFPS
jgi:hypothetical protein